jgi:hypothetical protein
MTTDDFFEEQSEQSLVKATITAKYFDVWASIMIYIFGNASLTCEIAMFGMGLSSFEGVMKTSLYVLCRFNQRQKVENESFATLMFQSMRLDIISLQCSKIFVCIRTCFSMTC